MKYQVYLMEFLLCVIILLVLTLAVVIGAEAPKTVRFDFAVLDLQVNGKAAWVQDINRKGGVIANTFSGGLSNTVLISKDPRNRKKTKFGDTETVSCGDTYGASYNDGGWLTGYCIEGAMVRQPDGKILILSALGENAMGNGVAKDNTVAGHYCTPNGPPDFGCTLHGFTWNPVTGYRLKLDYVDGRPGSRTMSTLIAPTSDGRVLGEYYVLDKDNDTLEHGHFIYDNGFFDTESLPKSFEHVGGPGVFIPDMAENGRIVVQRWNGEDGLQLYDDDRVYDIIGKPDGWIVNQVSGISEDQFVGRASVQVGIDPFYKWPMYKAFSFVATEAKGGQR